MYSAVGISAIAGFWAGLTAFCLLDMVWGKK